MMTLRFVRPLLRAMTGIMKITNYHGRTGSGKSKQMKENIVRRRGRHLLVVPRKTSIQECYDDLLRLRTALHLDFPIRRFLREDRKRYDTKISKEITDCAAKYLHEDDHCCLIITQAAFQQLDPARFSDWHLKLDELLTNGNPSGSLYAPVMWRGLAKMFSVTRLTKSDLARGIDPSLKWLRLRKGIEAKDVMRDPRLSKEDLNLFHRVASPIPVYIDAKSIKDIGRRRCDWCSPWTLDQADSYASLEIAACDIEQSLMHLLSPRNYDKVLVPSDVSAARIRILYFDGSSATCSANYWETDQGKANLTLVGKEIARRGGADYWTCNESAESVLKPLMPKHSATRERKRKDDGEAEVLNEVDGTWIRQQQDGINLYRECTSCAILISSKAQEHESIFAKLSPAASRAAISKGREDGLIFQFVSRGVIRMQSYAGDYTIYVYDRQQAEALRDKLVGYDFPQTEIEHVEVEGFTDRVRPAKGRKPIYLTPEERENARRVDGRERSRRHREKRKLSVLPPTAILTNTITSVRD